MNWQFILESVYADVKPVLGEGRVADYIPALATADPGAFGMSAVMLNGDCFSVGASDTRFSIQSISKVFSLALALRNAGDTLWDDVGHEPSGTTFNSIVQLERENGRPRNPFINAGALVVTDSIISQYGRDRALQEILAFIDKAAGSAGVSVNKTVAASEETWGDRNRSLAYFMKSFGTLKNLPTDVLNTYFHQCAIEMTTASMAHAGLFLANDGIDPISGSRFATHEQVNRINALMLTCGHYDMSGDFACRVGLPGKSGVGGGILAVAPGKGVIAVWSPALNQAGNSHAGTLALEFFSDRADLNLF